MNTFTLISLLMLDIAYGLADRHEYSMANAILNVYPSNSPKAIFYKGYVNYRLEDKAKATTYLRQLESSFEQVPERYKTVAMLMLIEMETWRSDDLAAASRKMEDAWRRLGNAKAGPQTQNVQKDIVKRLDKLIKQKEDAIVKLKSEAQGNSIQERRSPKESSDIANDGGTGKVDLVKIRKLSEAWGQLPPRERERALQELTRSLPARYREAIENSFRNIAVPVSKKGK